MKADDRKNRFSMTLLFSAIIFMFLLITMFIIVAAIIILVRHGVLKLGTVPPPNAFFIWMGVVSIFLGTVLAIIVGKYPLKPINKILNAMNRLAAGDYKVRLSFKGPIAKAPVSAELIDSFNTMASELENTELLRSDFVNNFSHEFKTPIVSIAGFARLLRHGDLTDRERSEYLDIIEEESLRLSGMATNMLNLTKIENQTILTDISDFNLSEQIRNCVLLLESKWTRKNIDIILDFGEVLIYANEDMLKEVWINLLDNAVKFTPDFGAVQVSIQEEKDGISVCVMNTGSKIPAENLEKIFHKFYRSDESHSSEGNGIGLAVVKKIVELHKGTVNVESDEIKTTFKVYLPK